MPEKSQRPKILIADDEPDANEILKEAFEEFGCEVEIAVSGDEAMLLIQSLGPDVLLLDLKIPRLDGESILKKIHERNLLPEMKIIILTGYNDFDRTRNNILSKFGRRVSAYLEKPVDLEQLLRLVFKELDIKFPDSLPD